MILDTNAISGMAERDPELEKILPEVPSQFIPVICLGEYRAAVIRSRARGELERWLELLEETRPVLPVDRETARWYAGIMVDLRRRGSTIPMNDVWIAALALQHDLPVVSHDQHFDQVKNLHRISW